jgi:hypothetical protein
MTSLIVFSSTPKWFMKSSSFTWEAMGPARAFAGESLRKYGTKAAATRPLEVFSRKARLVIFIYAPYLCLKSKYLPTRAKEKLKYQNNTRTDKKY